MSQTDHNRAGELFLGARECSAGERSAYLDRECGQDDALRAEVESLLEADGRAAALDNVRGVDLCEGLRDIANKGGAAQEKSDERIPERIGQYRVIREIGQGGMGTVYEAEQQSPKRRVALKVIRSALISRQLLQRFQLEAHVLGQLQHPGIAQIYEAHIDEESSDQAPFFAMELLGGPSLGEFCATRELTVEQRLELLARVCDAVQHAHQKGIIHRDLKPANILVVEADAVETGHDATDGTTFATAVGQPKVVDFGIARMLDSDHHAITLETNAGQLLGTLCYMSPEQVSGRLAGIDTRCDVYALGVILYELLAGQPPFLLRGLAITEATRIVCEDEPSPLSSISARFRGDVDTIVGKAMDKQRDRRYATTAELAADIRRYLRQEPIQARPPTAYYQLSKFARRNKALMGGVLATAAALVLGLISSLYWLRQSTLREAQLQSVADFQGRMLTGIDVEDMGRQMLSELRTAARRFAEKDSDASDELLDRFDRFTSRLDATGIASRVLDEQILFSAVDTVGHEFADQPLVEAELRMSMGRVYDSLGLYDKARVQFRAAHELRRGLLGDDAPDTLAAARDESLMLAMLGWYAEARPNLTDAVERLRRMLGDEHPDTIRSLLRVATVEEAVSDYDQAERDCRTALDLARRALGPTDPLTIEAMASLGSQLRILQRTEEAEMLLRDALEASQESLGSDHPDTIAHMKELALLLDTERRYAEAEPYLQEVHQRYLVLYGADHPNTLSSGHSLGEHYVFTGKYDLAEPLLREALEKRRRILGPEHPATLRSLNTLSHLLIRTDRGERAVGVLQECYEVARRTLGESNNTTTVAACNLASVYSELGQFADAEKYATLAYEGRREIFGSDHYRTLSIQMVLAEIHLAAGRFEESEQLLDDLLKVIRDAGATGTPLYTSAVSRLAQARVAIDRAAEAEPLCRKLLTHCQTHMESMPGVVGLARRLLATSLIPQGKFDEAECLLEEALSALKEQLSDDHWQVHYTQALLGAAHYGQGKDDSIYLLRDGVKEVRKRQGQIKIAERRLILEQLTDYLATVADQDASAGGP